MIVDDTTSTPSTEYATDVFQDEDGLVGATTKHDIVVQMMSKKKGDMFLSSHKLGHEGARMHGSGSNQKSISGHQVMYYVGMQESVLDAERINQVGYFFGLPRPPEHVTCIKKFVLWDRLCLRPRLDCCLFPTPVNSYAWILLVPNEIHSMSGICKTDGLRSVPETSPLQMY